MGSEGHLAERHEEPAIRPVVISQHHPLRRSSASAEYNPRSPRGRPRRALRARSGRTPGPARNRRDGHVPRQIDQHQFRRPEVGAKERCEVWRRSSHGANAETTSDNGETTSRCSPFAFPGRAHRHRVLANRECSRQAPAKLQCHGAHCVEKRGPRPGKPAAAIQLADSFTSERLPDGRRRQVRQRLANRHPAGSRTADYGQRRALTNGERLARRIRGTRGASWRSRRPAPATGLHTGRAQRGRQRCGRRW
jgi:hypothetical protein